MSHPQTNLFELYQGGLASAADAVRTCLECAERLRAQQLAATRDAVSEISRWADDVRATQKFEGLFALQSQIAGLQFQSTVGYWSRLYRAGCEMQLDVLKQVSADLWQMRARLQDTLGAAGGGALPAMALETMETILITTSSAFAKGARATEEAAKLASEHATTAEAALRYAAEKSEKGRAESRKRA